MRRPWTLRTRLLVALLALCAAGLAVVATTSLVLLERSLMARIDQQLDGMVRPLVEDHRRPGPGRLGPGGRGGSGREFQTTFRVIILGPEGATKDVIGNPDEKPDGPVLPAMDRRSVAERGPLPFTVADRAGGSDWRMRTVLLPVDSIWQPEGGVAAVGQSLAERDATVNQLLLIELGVGALVLLLLGVVATSVVRLGLRPLTKIEHTAAAIATGEIDRRVPDSDPRTETGRVGAALNIMLGRLGAALREREESEIRLRHFVGDASHELRTPLTSIRGFAELYRRGGASEPADIDRLMSRIESEAIRMGLLVEDLLLLAQLDEQPTLDLAEVDLLVLASDAVHDAQARDPDRTVTLVAEDGPVRVVGDEHRLRQVVGNLVSNALTHTPAGTAVRVSVGRQAVRTLKGVPAAAAGATAPTTGTVAVLEVTDQGSGVPDGHAPHVFDRFYRADPARSRSNGGSGLGLAITAAIVSTHGGRVELHGEPGPGATFRVLLPLG